MNARTDQSGIDLGGWFAVNLLDDPVIGICRCHHDTLGGGNEMLGLEYLEGRGVLTRARTALSV